MNDASHADFPREHWARVYREAPEVFAAFAAAEDPEGRVARALLAHAELAGRVVLEVGAGTGRLARALAPTAARYLALEPARGMLGQGVDPGPAAQVLRARGERLPFHDATVDRIVAAWVLANLRNEVQSGMLAEVRRVLRPGGSAWIVENLAEGEFAELRGAAARHEAARVQRLMDGGFRIVEVIETSFRFPSAPEAERVLGALCGEGVRSQLQARPRAEIGHTFALLRLDA